MATVFIADDEAVIREGIKCLIPWDALGYTIIGEAGNGEDALREILANSPDVVLMDIKMPKMTGLECVSNARERGFKGKFLILSGYSDFKYAKEAMKYGVEYYLTKPIDEDELTEALIQVKKNLDDQAQKSENEEQFKAKAKNVILHELVHGIAQIDEEQAEGMSLQAEVYQVVTFENFSKDTHNPSYNFAELLKVTNQGKHFFESFEEDHKDIILLKGKFALDKFQNFLDHYEKHIEKGSPLDSIFLAYGSPVYTLDEIHCSYEEATTLLSRRFFCEQGQHTLGYEELPKVENVKGEITDQSIADYSSRITDLLQSFNRKKVVDTLSELEDYLYNVKNDIASVKLFLSDLYLQVKEHMNHVYNTSSIPFPTNSAILEFIEAKNYLYEIIQYLSEQFEMIMSAIGNSNRDSVLDDIVYYIDHNFVSNIKLESIAPLFGYNSAYLGKIFNKTVGESFNSYVDHVRINYSKELLSQNKMKVYEIAEQVGYKNVDYFHKKFKKYVGESPAEFRKKVLGDKATEEE